MIRLKPATLLVIVAALCALVGFVAFETAQPVTMGKSTISDFDIFYLASTMISEGRLAEAYDPAEFLARQPAMPGYDGTRLLWSYPPTYDLIIAPLSLLPNWASYLVFITITLTAYLLVLHRLAGEHWQAVLVAFLPMIALIVRAGQNGFLIATLVGLTALLALRGSRLAGMPLGMMIVKPHLALGIGLWALLELRWRLVAVSFATIAAMSGLAALAFGPEIWPTAIEGVRKTGAALQDGEFILYRMTSIYAFVLSFGASPALALALHSAVVLAAFGALISLRLMAQTVSSARIFLAAGIFMSCLISPYNHDYDLAMLSIAASLVCEGIAFHATRVEKMFLVACIWFIGGYGFVASQIVSHGGATPPSLTGAVLAAVGICLWRILSRASKMTDQVVRQSPMTQPIFGPR